MSLLLDPRRRAMLREMGVTVWQPEPARTQPATVAAEAEAEAGAQERVANPPVAIDLIANNARKQRAKELKDPNPTGDPTNTGLASHSGSAGPGRPATATTAPPPRTPLTTPRAGRAAAGAALWQVGAPQALYADAPAKTSPAHWLILGETPAASLQPDGGFDALAGETGTLLGNMLRAARLPSAASVLFVPLARLLPSSPAQSGLADALAPLLAETRPDIVLLMGRLAAQAALTTDEPLGQLRGRVHRLHGCAAVLTYDAAHLLRNPDNKARAWDDLCLATQFAGNLPPSPGRA